MIRKLRTWKLGLVSFVPVLAFFWIYWPAPEPFKRPHDLNGVNFVGPREAFDSDPFDPVLEIHANWVAVIPYAFCRPNQPDIYFDSPNQWWGEKIEGVIRTIEYAQQRGLKVMLKPQMWVAGHGWPGDFTMETDGDWIAWERNYESYLMTYVRIADSMEVEMICIGTEFRHSVRDRSEFWEELISKVRNQYQGKLTYAANWDNFENVQFWDQLDYIGIDAYFPLIQEATPEAQELVGAWDPHLDRIAQVSHKAGRPVIFTEYGYRSVSNNASQPWDTAGDDPEVDLIAQRNCYQALFEALSDRDWYHGGFLWKWFADPQAGGLGDSGFTPQNKPVIQVVKQQFSLKD